MNRSLPRAAASAGLEKISEVLVDLAGLEEESIVPVAALHQLQVHLHPCLAPKPTTITILHKKK